MFIFLQAPREHIVFIFYRSFVNPVRDSNFKRLLDISGILGQPTEPGIIGDGSRSLWIVDCYFFQCLLFNRKEQIEDQQIHFLLLLYFLTG